MNTSKDKFDFVVLGLVAAYLWTGNISRLFYSFYPTVEFESVMKVSLIVSAIFLILLRGIAKKQFGWFK